MLSGKIKHKAQLYKRTGEDNNVDYTYYKPINIQILYKSGASVVQSYQLLNTKAITVKIRNRKDLESTMKIKIKDEFYSILHIQPIGGFNEDILIDLQLTA